MNQSAPRRSPDPPHLPAAAGVVLVAADFGQSLVWIRFDGAEKIAIALEPAEARELARAIFRTAQDVDDAPKGRAGDLVPV